MIPNLLFDYLLFKKITNPTKINVPILNTTAFIAVDCTTSFAIISLKKI